MIKFFRNIRKKLLNEGKTSRYFKYAIGEIILVVIGILIALQINNWNENRKAQKLAKENYINLLTSLEQDLIKVKKISNYNKKSLVALRKIIPTKINDSLFELNDDDLNTFLIELGFSVRSFIPQTGVYNLLTSNNGFDLMKSDKIKSSLIHLYDYQYKAYEDLDKQVDNKYHSQLGTVLRQKIVLIIEYNPNLTITHRATMNRFEEHFEELALASRDLYPMIAFNTNNLVKIEESITKLIPLINVEINK
ncbi:DUF6090 family protein [Hanstruepera ponticola]|uniref:DUF6090 family protein n=1 Tax=Hanstruepera ponticola TaxID=2042995 RepID=UPI00177E6CA4|nr:DUF6090 family protein [Hanstruepera ponticola]